MIDRELNLQYGFTRYIRSNARELGWLSSLYSPACQMSLFWFHADDPVLSVVSDCCSCMYEPPGTVAAVLYERRPPQRIGRKSPERHGPIDLLDPETVTPWETGANAYMICRP